MNAPQIESRSHAATMDTVGGSPEALCHHMVLECVHGNELSLMCVSDGEKKGWARTKHERRECEMVFWDPL